MRLPTFRGAAPSPAAYRPEIDGLRALAVLAVVAFHAFPSLAPGGFVGVDVFFVISGYLITTIIVNDVERRRFRFVSFYRRRILRIFPALSLVLVACLGLGWVVLFADEYRFLGKHVGGGAGFVSNFLLWREAGYFDRSSDTKPLLHLWSLGIEEQFYIVWPLIVSVLVRRRINGLVVVGILGAVSFGLNLHTVGIDATAAFYSPQTRFWELMIGAAIAFARRPGGPPLTATPVVAEALAAVGLLSIVVSVFVLTSATPFPGVAALLPTLGAAALIVAGQRAVINRGLFSNRPMVAIGLISFPLYLWHWPLLVFARILGGAAPSPTTRVGLVILAFVLASATYVGWEKLLRFRGDPRRNAVGLIASMIVIASCGAVVYAKDGVDSRRVVALNLLKTSGDDGGDGGLVKPECGIADVEARSRFAYCLEDSREAPRYALIGDSKAGALYPGLIRTSTVGARWLFIGGTNEFGSTLPVLSDDPLYRSYRSQSVRAIDTIAHDARIDVVAIVASTRALFHLSNDSSLGDLPNNPNEAAARAGLAAAVSAFVANGKQVLLVIDNPTLPHPEDCLGRRSSLAVLDALFARPRSAACVLSYRRQLALSSNYRAMLASIAATDPAHVQVFDPLPLLCDARDDACPIATNGRLLYGVTDHLSDYGSGIVGKAINSSIDRIGRR